MQLFPIPANSSLDACRQEFRECENGVEAARGHERWRGGGEEGGGLSRLITNIHTHTPVNLAVSSQSGRKK